MQSATAALSASAAAALPVVGAGPTVLDPGAGAVLLDMGFLDEAIGGCQWHG